MIDSLDHFVLTVRDIDATVAFYRDVLGMTPEEFGEGRLALKFGKQKINLHRAGHEFEPKAKTPAPGSADVCFLTATPIEAVIETLAQHRVPIVEGPVSKTGAQGPLLSVYVRDPDENLIEISNQVERPAFLGFDHLDTRVPSLAKVEKFYDKLMPLLGLPRKKKSFVDDAGEWHDVMPDGTYNAIEYYTPPAPAEVTFFIGFIERADTAPTLTRIAFRVPRESLEGWVPTLRELGARNVEPAADLDAYPAIFFEDPGGTKLELTARMPA